MYLKLTKHLLLLCLTLVFNCKGNAQKQSAFKITKTDTQWKAKLSKNAYNVLRKAETEPPFSSSYNSNTQKGIYTCAGCDTPLFKSEHKFDSGTGWPSFDQEIKGNVAFATDYKIGYSRTEEHCANCGGHLGHVFNDGPQKTTGKRHCINGVALKFIPNKND